jgi:hypothetical protein
MSEEKKIKIAKPMIFKFSEAYKAPEMKYNLKKGLIEWGEKNMAAKHILDLYNFNGSPVHKSIIDRKTKMISGQGIEWDKLSPELSKFLDVNKFEKELRKATLDYELFNGFAFEIIWNREGTGPAVIQHIPFHKIRIGIKNDDVPFEHYWFSNDWSQVRKEEFKPELLRAFNHLEREGKVLYYYSEYNPATDGLYPIPEYSTAMNWIELGYEISKFHLNQAKQGYSMSFILNFATGIPVQEEMEEFEKEFRRQYAGTENSGKIVITWSDGVDGKPELIPIQLNNSDERFLQLKDQIQEEIVQASEIPPQLIILTPGKLGGTDERTELLIEFQKTYVSPRQNNIEEALYDIFGEEIILKKYTE